MTTKTGTLYLCATPIGNLEDMTYRVVRTLQEVDLIAAEDTRNTGMLLNHLGREKKPLISYYEHNKTDPEIAFEYVTDTLCWYLTYGWEHYPDGSLSTTPILNEDTSKILNLDPKIKTYYAPVISKLKEEIYNYIDSDLPLFMDCICSDVTGRGFGTFT